MDLTRLAAYSIVAGCLLAVVAAVAYFDWRAGVVVVAAMLIVGGVESLRSRNG